MNKRFMSLKDDNYGDDECGTLRDSILYSRRGSQDYGGGTGTMQR
eukprot:CAMPEP_0176402770 /NCGR_PEP_ID=MMETSP0126-20121128/49556_1 /TAXON_ID=141414 ORGANISM="Strombidinopsis acuminatum, Strain SPMC142" /NCGR_SAMPLE_ID=MMETSP0126 /ASSEMBLY_ACC=CAM_ASM_000229 /LENGTH=44 /DNA_ID= /DNA_START= /DNA_END= /DNA_ORIENTATION=